MVQTHNPDLAQVLSQYCETFTFQSRPEPVHYTHRADYRLVLLLLMIHFCAWGGKISIIKLHVLNWASRSPQSRRALLERLNGKKDFRDIPVRFDPAFNRAIDLARGESLVQRELSSQSLSITSTGRSVIDEVLSDKSILTHERLFFSKIGKKLTDAKVNEIINPQTLW